MPPQENSTGSLDPQVVALAKAVRDVESGGNPTASGKSGEYGAYQYEPSTWAKQAAAAGVNVPLQQASLADQNKVWYTWAKQKKDEGYTPGQIISMQNAGEGEPNAYTGKFSNGAPSTGTNHLGVPYDVRGYTQKVYDRYQKYKEQQPQQKTPGKSLGEMVSNLIQTIFPGKQIGEAIGTEIAKLQHPSEAQAIQKYEPGPTAGQVAGDVGQAALMIGAPGIGTEGSAFSRIAQTAALGAGSGLASGLSSGETDVNKLAGSAVTGGLVGGGLGTAGELATKAINYLPYRLARTFLPGTSKETAQYAVDKGLGAPTKMLDQSNSSLTKIGNGIESTLNHGDLADVRVTAADVYQPIMDKFGDAGLTPEEVGNQIRHLVPLKKNLVDKLETEGLTAPELNRLKTAIGKATYKTVFDEPAVKAGKDIGNTAYAAISQWLENKVPEAAPLFEEYNKELQLNKALTQAIRRGEKSKPLTLRDLVALLAGTPLGLGGSIGALAAEKALTSPTVNLMAGGLLSRLPTQAIGGIARQGLTRGLAAQGNTGQ